MNRSKEVLVHISAPSKTADDERYRALAQAYLDFEPAERISVARVTIQAGEKEQAHPSSSSKIQSPNLSFADAWDNAGSPGLRRPTGRLQQGSSASVPSASIPNKIQYVSPVAMIPDSQPDGLLQRRDGDASDFLLAMSSVSDIASTPTRHTAEEGSLAQAASPDLSMLPRKEEPVRSSQPQSTPRSPLSQKGQSSQQPPQLPRDTSLLSNFPILSQESEQSECPSENNIPSSLPEEAGQVIPQRDIVASKPELDVVSAREWLRSESAPVRIRHGTVDCRLRTIEKAISDVGPLTKRRRIATPIQNEAALRRGHNLDPALFPSPYTNSTLYPNTSLRIIAPEPPIACDHLNASKLVTDKLARLARDLDLERRYKPDVTGTKPPGPLDRGFWRIDTSAWPSKLRQEAWDYLADYIGRGDAGWAVWCSRDEHPHTWLRLHAFASLAGHTYLLLYLASERKINETGAVWMDGTCAPALAVPVRHRTDTKIGKDSMSIGEKERKIATGN